MRPWPEMSVLRPPLTIARVDHRVMKNEIALHAVARGAGALEHFAKTTRFWNHGFARAFKAFLGLSAVTRVLGGAIWPASFTVGEWLGHEDFCSQADVS